MSAPATRSQATVHHAAGQEAAVEFSGAIPVAHAPIDASDVALFSDWIDQQLVQLEDRFSAFTTRNALKGALKR